MGRVQSGPGTRNAPEGGSEGQRGNLHSQPCPRPAPWAQGSSGHKEWLGNLDLSVCLQRGRSLPQGHTVKPEKPQDSVGLLTSHTRGKCRQTTYSSPVGWLGHESASKKNGCPQGIPLSWVRNSQQKAGLRAALTDSEQLAWGSLPSRKSVRPSSNLPPARTWHLVWGRGPEGAPWNPHSGKQQGCPEKARTGLQGSPPRSKDIIWGKEVPVYQDQSHGAFVYRAVCWTMGMRPGRPSEFTNMGQHSFWHWEVTSKRRDNF